MPDSSSTTSPMGASLSDLLFSFVLEKYIVCEVCGLRSPSFESSSVLHISPTDTPSMQNLIWIDLDTLIIISSKIDAPYL